jgi:hypothetical protein
MLKNGRPFSLLVYRYECLKVAFTTFIQLSQAEGKTTLTRKQLVNYTNGIINSRTSGD